MANLDPSQASLTVKRALHFSRGLFYLVGGTLALIAWLVVEQWPQERGLVLFLVPVSGGILWWTYRRRRSHGLWAAEKGEDWWDLGPSSPSLVGRLLTIGTSIAGFLAIALIVVGGGIWVYTGALPQALFHGLVACGCFCLGLGAAQLALALRLWEQLLSSAWFLGGGLYAALWHGGHGPAVGGGLMLMGLLLHIRWWTWTRPLEGSAAPSGVAQ